MNAFKTLFLTELKLSWRGLDMVIFALALPVVVMVLIGLLYGQQAAFAGVVQPGTGDRRYSQRYEESRTMVHYRLFSPDYLSGCDTAL